MNSTTFINKKLRLDILMFYFSLCIMFSIIAVAGYDIGTNADEINTNTYAKHNIAYYVSFGSDTSFMHLQPWDGSSCVDNYRYYGSGFDYANFLVYAILGKWSKYYSKVAYEYHMRHLLVQFFAVLGIMLSGLIAKKISGYRAGFIVIWLLFLTPMINGHALMNYRDIPFLTGFVAALYFMLIWLEELPRINLSASAGIIISIAFACSIRIGGVILFPIMAWGILLYYIRARNNKEAFFTNSLVLATTSIFIVTMCFTIVLWPYALSDINHIFEAMDTFKSFKYSVQLTFEGIYTRSTDLPWYYLLKSFYITIPVFILLILFTTAVYCLIRFKECGSIAWLFIFGATIFPLIYIILQKTTLYNGWRHVLFLYPGIIICSSIIYSHWISIAKSLRLKVGLIVLLFVGLIHPIVYCIQNSPYQYTYGNELIGGFEGIYYDYEGEYQQLSITENIKWLFEHEPILQSKDTVVIASNQYSEASFVIKSKYPNAKVKVVSTAIKHCNGVFWHYAVLSNLFLEPDYLKSSYPPDYTIHTRDIAKLPIGVVLKNFNRLDYWGMMAFVEEDYNKADTLISAYLKTVRWTERPYRQYSVMPGMLAACKYMRGDIKQAYLIAQKELLVNPDDEIAQQIMTEINKLRK